ncbi:MAG TPA: hypothetical protein VMT76_00620 [Puia sp.]|nr:hypothetical protein [Puia sp.]
MKLKNLFAILLATAWISLSEFFRNEILFKQLWTDHYQKLGLVFPSETSNKIAWVAWSFMLTGLIYNIAQKFSLAGTTLLSWFAAFAMMWIVIGNLGVLPHKLMLYATPLSLLETFVAALIIQKVSDRHP